MSAIHGGHKNPDNTTHLPTAKKTSDKQQFALFFINFCTSRRFYDLVALFIFIYFFCSRNFRRFYADFRETLPHGAVCPEIVYLI